MSEDDLQLEEQMDELPYQNLKCLNQCTAISFKHKNTYQSAIFDVQSFTHGSTDNSFEQAIHQQNVEILKNATIKYLQETIDEPFNKNEGFKDVSLYECPPFQPPAGNQFEMITLYNQLLSEKQKQELLSMLKEEEQLVGFMKQLTPVFGITVSKELTFIVFHILKQKLTNFRQMKAPRESVLPRFDCFHGFDEQQKMFNTACNIYEDLNFQQISQLAEKDIEIVSNQLYYSSQIKVLTLKQIKYDPKSVIFPTKFNNLIKSVSRSLFYSLAGSVEQNQSVSGLFSLDISREVSFSEFTQGNILSIQRSISRPFVSCEEEQLDFLSKRLKFDQS